MSAHIFNRQYYNPMSYTFFKTQITEQCVRHNYAAASSVICCKIGFTYAITPAVMETA
jgi:hypothetical protein